MRTGNIEKVYLMTKIASGGRKITLEIQKVCTDMRLIE